MSSTRSGRHGTPLPAPTSYRETITRAVAYGHDTDTTACIAGGLAGAYWGFDRHPAGVAGPDARPPPGRCGHRPAARASRLADVEQPSASIRHASTCPAYPGWPMPQGALGMTFLPGKHSRWLDGTVVARPRRGRRCAPDRPWRRCPAAPRRGPRARGLRRSRTSPSACRATTTSRSSASRSSTWMSPTDPVAYREMLDGRARTDPGRPNGRGRVSRRPWADRARPSAVCW